MQDLRGSMWKSFDEGSVTCYKCVGRLTAGFLIRITDMFGVGVRPQEVPPGRGTEARGQGSTRQDREMPGQD